jgi:transposase
MIVLFDSYQANGKKICLFYDGDLKQREENDYLSRIETHPEKYSLEEFHQRKNRFGTIALLHNLKEDLTAEKLYASYKSRGSIELAFDGLKNVMKGDVTYMQNEDALQGWMFINHITLQWYYLIYARLKNKELLKKVSVSDVIMHLKETRKARMNGKWVLEPIVKSTNDIFQKMGYHIT